ncbi:MAG TPA: penicillin-binding protein activator [Oleiagrimonas sp.]|nr:penicillin-binding protein activator [Oleiagrimonas sp.]
MTVSTTPSPEQQAQARQAQTLFHDGHYQQAAQAWAKLAAQDRSTRDYFLVRAAEAWREAGSLPKAEQALTDVERTRLQPTDARHYDLLEAEIALNRGNAARALTLTQGPVAALPDALQTRALELRARALAKTGKPWKAARTRIALDATLSGAGREHNRKQTLDLLNSMGVEALQQHASALPSNAPAQRWIALALGRLGVNVSQAAPSLTQPVGTFMPGSSQLQGYQLPSKVALMLPLSGPLASAGTAVRQGFFASYFQAGKHGELPPVQVYDTTGTPAGALSAYQRAVADGATLVVGPLTHDAVSAVMQQAQLPATLLALNHPDDNILPPPNATEFALRPEVEAAQVARRMFQQGLTQAIVMVSSEGFAQRAADAFTIEFQGLGGQITSLTTLNPAQVDYRKQTRALQVTAPATTGVFISMRPEQARLLLPQLHLAGIKLPVFATSHVYDARNNPVADGDLNGVTFCDAPWLFNTQPGLPSRAALAASLPAARGTSARLFAFGMDAWSLVPYLQWMRAHPGSYLPGASGRLTEDAFGRIQRVLTWARFENGVARPLVGNLELGTPTLQPLPAASSSSAPSRPTPASTTSAPAPPTSAPIGH